MTNDNHIPEIDQKLAQKVGASLEENRTVLSTDDYLIERIVSHKQYLYQTFENELAESRQKSWEEISSSIHTSSKSESQETNIKSIFSSQSTFWKVAAVFILAAMLSVFLLRSNVNQPDILAQSTSEQITYALNDGSNVHLRPHSTLYVISRSDAEEHYKLEGEAFFNITKDEHRRFLVDAGHGIVEVVGTSFNVREWADETVVYLQEGSLRFTASDGSEEVLLNPGEVVSVSKDLSVPAPVKADGAEYISWQNNEIIFDNRTAESIIQELEHHYSINILAPDSIKNEILGGTLSLENRSVSLENLGIVLGGNFSSINKDTYQFVE